MYRLFRISQLPQINGNNVTDFDPGIYIVKVFASDQVKIMILVGMSTFVGGSREATSREMYANTNIDPKLAL